MLIFVTDGDSSSSASALVEQGRGSSGIPTSSCGGRQAAAGTGAARAADWRCLGARRERLCLASLARPPPFKPAVPWARLAPLVPTGEPRCRCVVSIVAVTGESTAGSGMSSESSTSYDSSSADRNMCSRGLALPLPFARLWCALLPGSPDGSEACSVRRAMPSVGGRSGDGANGAAGAADASRAR